MIKVDFVINVFYFILVNIFNFYIKMYEKQWEIENLYIYV